MPDPVTPKPGETEDTSSSKTAVTPPVTPPVSPSGNEDMVPRAELQKIEQERNMWRKKASDTEKNSTEQLTDAQKKAEDAQAAADEERMKREKIEQDIADRDKKAAVDVKESEILSGYSTDVKDLAKELGVTLSDPEDEDSLKSYTEKLDKLNAKVGGGTPPKRPPVGGNNNPPAKKEESKKSEEQELKDLEANLKDVKF